MLQVAFWGPIQGSSGWGTGRFNNKKKMVNRSKFEGSLKIFRRVSLWKTQVNLWIKKWLQLYIPLCFLSVSIIYYNYSKTWVTVDENYSIFCIMCTFLPLLVLIVYIHNVCCLFTAKPATKENQLIKIKKN